MIVLWATVVGCADTGIRPPALRSRWRCTVEYPGLTLHTTLRHPLTLLELTDTTTTQTDPGSYNTEVRLIRE